MTSGKPRQIEHSVIIPTCGRPDLLERCLRTLMEAAEPSWEWEVLVVDNGSNAAAAAGNRAVVEAAGDERVRYVTMEPWGLAAARHRGVRESSGRVVSFLDDDSFVGKTWLVAVQETLADPAVVLAGGPNLPEYESAPPAWLEGFWTEEDGIRTLGYLSMLDAGSEVRSLDPRLVWGCNTTITREMFERVRGGNPDSMPPHLLRYQGNGEVGLTIKVAALGHDALYVPELSIKHFVPASRATHEYFLRRSYVFGIEESYVDIRVEHGLGPQEGVPARDSEPEALSAPDPLRALAARVRNRVLRRDVAPASAPEPTDRAKFEAELAAAKEEGRSFLRNEVESDPELLRYVLLPDYMSDEIWREAAKREAAQ